MSFIRSANQGNCNYCYSPFTEQKPAYSHSEDNSHAAHAGCLWSHINYKAMMSQNATCLLCQKEITHLGDSAVPHWSINSSGILLKQNPLIYGPQVDPSQKPSKSRFIDKLYDALEQGTLANYFVSDEDRGYAVELLSTTGHSLLLDKILETGPISLERRTRSIENAIEELNVPALYILIANHVEYRSIAMAFAIDSNDLEALQELMNSPEDRGLALKCAVQNNNIGLALWIFSTGEILDADMDQSIQIAARSGYTQLCLGLVQWEQIPHASELRRNQAIVTASLHHQTETISALLNLGGISPHTFYLSTDMVISSWDELSNDIPMSLRKFQTLAALINNSGEARGYAAGIATIQNKPLLITLILASGEIPEECRMTCINDAVIHGKIVVLHQLIRTDAHRAAALALAQQLGRVDIVAALTA